MKSTPSSFKSNVTSKLNHEIPESIEKLILDCLYEWESHFSKTGDFILTSTVGYGGVVAYILGPRSVQIKGDIWDVDWLSTRDFSLILLDDGTLSSYQTPSIYCEGTWTKIKEDSLTQEVNDTIIRGLKNLTDITDTEYQKLKDDHGVVKGSLFIPKALSSLITVKTKVETVYWD